MDAATAVKHEHDKQSANPGGGVNVHVCPICLEELSEAKTALECGHVFCEPCFSRYRETSAVRTPPCPCCRHVPSAVRAGSTRASARRGPRLAPLLTAGHVVTDTRALRRVRANIRVCPNCDAPIIKNGGCDHVHCPCGASTRDPTHYAPPTPL